MRRTNATILQEQNDKLNTIENLGLLLNDISDHVAIVATLSINARKINASMINPYIRDFRNFRQ